MIYTVECSYSDSASEEQWNDFYSLHKLPALISVRDSTPRSASGHVVQRARPTLPFTR